MTPEDKPMQASITASLLAGVLESAMDAVITVDARQNIVLFNHAAEKMFGWSRQEVMRQPLDKLIPGRFRHAHARHLEQFGATGETVRCMADSSVLIYGLRANGQEFPVDVSISQVDTPEGKLFTAMVRDITGRKLAGQALVDSEQRYAALFASAPVPMWVIDRASRKFLTVNQAAIEGYGHSASEFLSMMLPDIQTDAERSRLPYYLAQKRQGSCQHRRKDGSLFEADIVVRPIQYAGQEALFMVALDMSSQVKAEKEVQDHLFTLQRAADAAQAITWHLTLDGMMQELAEQARGVIGAHQAVVSLSAERKGGPGAHALSLSGEYAQYRDQPLLTHGLGIYAKGCHGTRPVRMAQTELQEHADWCRVGSHADRERMLNGWLAVPLTGRDGQPIGLLQLSDKYEGEFIQQDEYVATELAQLASIAIVNVRLLHEVSQLNTGLEKKVAERTLALARQEALFRALAEQAPQVIWTLDPNGDATYFNQAWFDLVGGSLRDWSGKQWFGAVHPDDLPDTKANWQLAQANQHSFSGLRRLLCKDGSVHTMAYRASPVRDEKGVAAFWVGIDADVTEIKHIEAALRLSNQELEAFSYSVSHDLRAPLSTINGFGSLLAKQLAGDGNDKMRHYVSRIQQGVAQMGQLIEDLLSLAQVARTQVRNEPVDLSEMALGILDAWRARQPEREVNVQIENDLQAYGDKPLLRVVMENLLGNAWKFSAHQPQATISVGQQVDAAGLPVFFVRDNGAGFDMAHAEKLFLPFERLHAASEFAGTGVGLATVSRVINRHGGKLWAEAAPGLGATFFFTLHG
ncbi:MAG: PAS domain S-box protein [Xanthomonadaceae bacterium]|nr:PAS domain S-box protein [Xanthomonadaceae bacterium]